MSILKPKVKGQNDVSSFSLFKRWFKAKPTLEQGPQKELIPKPLEVTTPILDNALAVLTALEEVCSILEISPYETNFFSDFEVVTIPSSVGVHLNLRDIEEQKAIVTRERTKRPSSSNLGSKRIPQSKDEYSEEIARGWIYAPELPIDFRVNFIRHLEQRDDLEETIARLSQNRWERLRHWIHHHDK